MVITFKFDFKHFFCMAFQERFESGVARFNEKVRGSPEILEVLEEYDGRSITLRVTDDTVYVFKIGREGLSLEVSPANPPEDMYLETSSQVLRRMLDEKKLNPTDLLLGKIKWRNISLKEVSIVKRLLEA